MTVPDFWEDDEDPGFLRPSDRWGRSSIIPTSGGAPEFYTRASTLAGVLSDKTGLHVWQRRMLVRGMAMRPDLVDLTASVGPECKDQRAKNAVQNRTLSEVMDAAHEAAGALAGARHGTLVHAASEPDADLTVSALVARDVEAIEAALADYGGEVVDHERFVACDALRAAGTFDRLVRRKRHGDMVIGDVKTGAEPHEIDVGIQMGTYANGDFYDRTTDEREKMPDDVSRKVGLLIHVPRYSGRADIYEVDIELGYKDAIRAAHVLKRRKMKTMKLVASSHTRSN